MATGATAALMCCLLGVGCGASASGAMDKLQNAPPPSLATSFQEVVKNAEGTAEAVQTRHEGEFEIDDDSPVIELPGPTRFRSHYKLFRFEAKTTFDLTLRSLCDCVGFNKSIALPVVYVLDAEGQVVSGEPITLKEEAPGMRYPFNVWGKWRGSVKAPGTHYLLIATDNGDPGTQRWTVYERVISFPMATNHPYGDFEIKFVAY